MRIRQGNDFIFLWAIERNGEPEDFSNAVNVRLHFKNYDCVGEVKSFQIVDGNIVRVEVSQEWASNLGAYRLILSYEFENQSYSDGDQKCVVDVLAFNIVPKTSEADDVSEMAKTTDIMIGLKGDKGDPFTYDDFTPEQIEDLKRPAIEAAESVQIIENQISLNEDGRVQAENEREIAETTRVSNENNRVTAEQERVNAENLRATAESSRELAESLRVEAELLRQSNTQEAILNAENATENANTAAQNADNARLAIQDDLAEYVKRSFIFDEPVNLLDGIVISRKNIPTTGANEIQDISSVNSRLMVAEIENGETYTVTKFEGGNTFRVATVDTYPDASGSIPTKHLFIDYSITSQERSYTFTNTENAKYVVLQSSNNIFSGELPLMQVEKGSVKTEFQEYGKTLKVKEKYIPNDFFEDIGREPIEGVKKLIGVGFNANVPPGIVSGSAHVNTVSYRVKLEPFEKITIRRVVGNRFYLATRNTPNPIEYVQGEYYPNQPTDNIIIRDNSLTEYNFVNNGTAVELWMYAYNGETDPNPNPESVEVLFERTESDVVSKDGFRLIADSLKEDANYAKRGYTERTLEEVEGIALSNSSALKRKVSTLYTPEDVEVFLTRPPLLDFYAKYDSLMADNPDYISKQVLGQDSQGNDIVQYTFKPVPVKGTEGRIVPKIGIVSGTHGDEKPAAYALYNSLKKIASGWREDKILENLRYNYEFVIIPVVTPSAFIANSRNNINNININRDFPSEAGGSPTGREPETQVVMQFLADNLDIDLFVDYHTDGYYPETNEYAYLLTWDEDIREVFRKTLVSLSAEWRATYPSVTQDDNVTFASLRTNPNATTMAYYAHLLGIKSGLLETMNTNYISTPVKSEAEITQIMDVEVLVNFINDYFKKI